MEPANIIIRSYNSQTDNNYIYSTWSKYSWYSPVKDIDHSISKHQFFKEKYKEIKDILANSRVNIACLSDLPYMIIGYIVVRDGIIEWLCVKKDYHHQNIEDLLKNSAKGTYIGEARNSTEHRD